MKVVVASTVCKSRLKNTEGKKWLNRLALAAGVEVLELPKWTILGILADLVFDL